MTTILIRHRRRTRTTQNRLVRRRRHQKPITKMTTHKVLNINTIHRHLKLNRRIHRRHPIIISITIIQTRSPSRLTKRRVHTLIRRLRRTILSINTSTTPSRKHNQTISQATINTSQLTRTLRRRLLRMNQRRHRTLIMKRRHTN